ncbi:h(+) cl(-) exchange transporter 7-like [Stylonychia lemnae]|uniref:Chloride channel protein n=1 Tax=Stylonychia lemnae TaxID=5949 RepID=A0A078ASA7_STYLE|nr:h(+) cl(-) exchange transporter 7-like [Stylonychia lemnae]|eukprot:CDW84851.1 h(+) cl(-) exchange transporter 7-like [Stylonychia lemnae]
MRADHSMKIYPRPDQEFKKKTSLDFQRVWGNIYKLRPTGSFVQGYMWLLCGIIGLMMGVTAFLLDILVEGLMKIRWDAAMYIIPNNVGVGWFVLVIISALYVFISAIMVIYIAPAALGSGVAEAMGILNGVAYPDYICYKTFFVKFFGLALAVSAGICGGKEGPLVHMGSICGYAATALPFNCFRYFRNDFEKRKLLAVGTAAGVSAAFGAPIGGSLFAYEMSKPSTFWSFSLTWKIFFASSISTFVLSICKQIYHGDTEHIKVINSGNVKLATSKATPYLDSMVAAIFLGAIGGMLGALFVIINNKLNYYRKKTLTQKWMKVLESVILVSLTVSVFYFASVITNECTPESQDDFMIAKGIEVKQFSCEEHNYNRLATLLFDSQSNTIKTFMQEGNDFQLYNMCIFAAVWYFFTCITSGTAVPCGIFLPCILIGCAVSQIYYKFHIIMFEVSSQTMTAGTLSILGAAAVLSGSTRMTYSLAVIMLETTSNVDLFLPIIFTLFSSYGIGTLLINKSIYLGALRSKNVPVIGQKIPQINRNLSAYNLMSTPVVSFHFVAKVGDVYFQLHNTKYSGFPVMNSRNQPIGIIERDTLITLIQKNAWYEDIGAKRLTSKFIDGKNTLTENGTARTSSFIHRYERYDEDYNQEKNRVPSNNINESMDDDGSQQMLNDVLVKQNQEGNEYDYQYPRQQPKLKWEDLNQNFKSAEKDYKTIEQIAIANSEQLLDLRPYMIERPFSVIVRDGIQKVHMMFRCLHLRQLLVTNIDNGEIQGIITRQDLFQYMTL